MDFNTYHRQVSHIMQQLHYVIDDEDMYNLQVMYAWHFNFNPITAAMFCIAVWQLTNNNYNQVLH